jgi:hypothetical protein
MASGSAMCRSKRWSRCSRGASQYGTTSGLGLFGNTLAAGTAAKPTLMLRDAGVPLGENDHVGRSPQGPCIAPFSRAQCGRLHGDLDGPFGVREGAPRGAKGSLQGGGGSAFSGDQCRSVGDLPPTTTWCRSAPLRCDEGSSARRALITSETEERSWWITSHPSYLVG